MSWSTLRVLVVDGGGLVLPGEEGIRPELRADHRASGRDRDIGGKILILRSETVGDP